MAVGVVVVVVVDCPQELPAPRTHLLPSLSGALVERRFSHTPFERSLRTWYVVGNAGASCVYVRMCCVRASCVCTRPRARACVQADPSVRVLRLENGLRSPGEAAGGLSRRDGSGYRRLAPSIASACARACARARVLGSRCGRGRAQRGKEREGAGEKRERERERVLLGSRCGRGRFAPDEGNDRGRRREQEREKKGGSCMSVGISEFLYVCRHIRIWPRIRKQQAPLHLRVRDFGSHTSRPPAAAKARTDQANTQTAAATRRRLSDEPPICHLSTAIRPLNAVSDEPPIGVHASGTRLRPFRLLFHTCP